MKKPSKIRKTFILDTSVLVYDFNAVYSYKNSDVVIPIAVLTELDKLKKQNNEVGKNARLCIRYLDELSERGNILDGVDVGEKTILKLDPKVHEAIGSDKDYGDNQILGCVSALKADGKLVVLVSRDINLRIRARAIGVESQDFSEEKKESYELYKGHKVIVHPEAGEKLNINGSISCADYEFASDVLTNEFILFTDENGESIATGRRYGKLIFQVQNFSPWGLDLRNKEQLYLTNLLMDDKVHLVSAIGKAGVGKTICVIASALELVLNKKKYDQLLIYRPIQPMGNDIGYIPGTVEEKLDPWFSAVDDAFSVLFADSKNRKKDAWKDKLHQYIDNGTIKKEALTYIRGRSISNALIIIDEFQNLSPDEAKTILTRAGIGSKIILTGDIDQIDNNRLDAINNGLTYVIDRFKGSRIAGHITLTKGERSELATLASEIL